MTQSSKRVEQKAAPASMTASPPLDLARRMFKQRRARQTPQLRPLHHRQTQGGNIGGWECEHVGIRMGSDAVATVSWDPSDVWLWIPIASPFIVMNPIMTATWSQTHTVHSITQPGSVAPNAHGPFNHTTGQRCAKRTRCIQSQPGSVEAPCTAPHPAGATRGFDGRRPCAPIRTFQGLGVARSLRACRPCSCTSG